MSAHKLFVFLFGIIFFAAAVYFGIGIVNSYSESANRDQLISALYDYGLLAQKFYAKPVDKGGGGLTFERWSLPKNYRSADYGSFHSSSKKKYTDLCGVGIYTGRNGLTNVRVTARVDSASIKVTIIN
jgi:hypothetical protein